MGMVSFRRKVQLSAVLAGAQELYETSTVNFLLPEHVDE
jgi:hypothetical protein